MSENLLPLPVPILADTIAQYLEAIQPITDVSSWEKSRKTAHAFVNSEGRLLQERLIRYAGELNGNSWLKEYSRERFLSLRTPLSIASNFSIEFKKAPWQNGCTQISVAARLAYSIGRLYQDIAYGRLLPPEGASSTIVQEQLSQVLGATRHPGETTDLYEVYIPFKQANSFGLFYKNRYYLVRLFDNQGNLISYPAIHSAIAKVAACQHTSLKINFHTAGFAGSKRCAQILTELTADKENGMNYEKMCRSIFHLALDDNPRDSYDFNHLLYSGTENLWLYKPWNFTVFADNTIAVNNEHTAVDGLSNMYLYQQLFQYIEQCAWAENAREQSADTEQIDFRFSLQQLQDLLDIRQKYLQRVAYFCYAEFRREKIDWAWFRQREIGRDALIQCGFAYAQYRLYGRFKSTHESISMAQYHQGRTSCLRSVTMASAELAKAMVKGGKSAETLLFLLKDASKEHSRNIHRAKQNICFIRHSAGLLHMYCLYGKTLDLNEEPAIFGEDNFKQYCRQELSTSTIGNSDIVNTFAFAPTEPDGLGLGYLTGDSYFQTSITCDGSQLVWGNTIVEYLHDYYDQLEQIASLVNW